MKVLIPGAGTRSGRKTSAAYGNYDRARRPALELRWFWRWCVLCSARSRQRKDLSALDDRLLEDIGVTRQQAKAEMVKPFWK